MMTMGEYIKYLRTGGNKYDKQWTQEEFGLLLKPTVRRAAINKWEIGKVENIKRTYIEQMANIFGISPCELMCFKSDEEKISNELKVIEDVQLVFGKDVVKLMHYYMELNEAGKEKALEDIIDLSDHPKYQK